MAFTYAKQDGYIKATESIVVAANSSGGTVDTSGSSLKCTGAKIVLAQADEESGLAAKLEYTMDSGQDVTVGGIGADPSAALSSSSQTWYEAKATEGNAETGVTADDTLEAFLVPKNAQYVRITYTADNGYGGSTEATELWIDGTNSSIDFSISGIGADPS